LWVLLCILSCGTASAARPITIDDIIGIRKIGAISVSPDGESVAYLVIQALVAKDGYSVSLVVTSSKETNRHDEILKRVVPAVRTEPGDVYEEIGANLTAGIVFAWDEGGKSLVYGVTDNNRTALFRYSPVTQKSVLLWQTEAEVARLVTVGGSKLGYCEKRSSANELPEGQVRDPAYRYDQATFHSYDKHPWQDARPYNDRDRPDDTPGEPIDCFERDISTKVDNKVAEAELQVNDAITPLYGPTMAQFRNRAYLGNPAVVAWVAPDKKKLLLMATLPAKENTNFERKYVFWIEDRVPGLPQRKLFEGAGEHEGDIRTEFWATDSQAIICIRKSLDHTELVRLDIATGSETSLLKTDWGINHPVLSPSGQYLYAIREKPNVPQQLCRLDLISGEMVLIDDINRQFASIQVPPYKVVRQFNQYGDELTGYLFYPPGFDGKQRLPFVAIRGQHWDVFCDGGTGVEFPGMVMALKGYVALFFEPSTKHYQPSLEGNAAFSILRFQSPMQNLSLLISSLDQQGWVNSKKTGIAGLSAGADLVNYAAGFSKVFAVGSATTGETYSPTNYFLFDSEQVDGLFTQRYRLPYPDAVGILAWQKVSTSLNASRSDMPLLFQPGDAEAWFTIPQHVAWKHANLPVATYVYPDEGHIKVHPLNRYYVMTRNVQWFDFWLRDIADPKPEFADQFKRWAKMRADWNATQPHHDSQPDTAKSVQ
jgi:dipeptidyl aminopeptidase/acylaminoacyl peptidase